MPETMSVEIESSLKQTSTNALSETWANTKFHTYSYREILTSNTVYVPQSMGTVINLIKERLYKASNKTNSIHNAD